MGLVTTETVKIGSLTVQDVPVGVATAVSVDVAGDGILGMGAYNNCRRITGASVRTECSS